MAYFPNGTSGMCYEEEYCQHCAHGHGADDDSGCAIMLLHMLFNYDQIGDTPEAKALKSCLGTLIPETPDKLGAERCAMFLPRDVTEEADLRRLAEQPRKYEQALAEMKGSAQ